MKKIIAVTVCVVAAGIAAYFASTDWPPSSINMAVKPAAKQSSRTSTNKGTSPIAREKWASRDTTGVGLMREAYERQSNLAEFFQTALQTPERGGLYYAKRVFADCYAIKSTARQTKLSADEQKALAPALKRCDIVGDAASYQRLSGTLSTSAASLDPVLSLTREFTGNMTGKTFKVEIVQRAVQRAIDMGDPYLLSDSLYRMIEMAQTFDGQSLDFATRQRLHAASTIAECDLGADCNGAPFVVLACAQTGQCGASLVSLILQGPQVTDDNERKAITQLADKLVAGARDGSLPSLFNLRNS